MSLLNKENKLYFSSNIQIMRNFMRIVNSSIMYLLWQFYQKNVESSRCKITKKNKTPKKDDKK